ncbi:hypothetical protein [Janthinobacterium sp. J1-1]|uniref:hypothetical protein n=1 Tax=Janthinobacterium sp. J1-1 TaxID=3065910 RepID=UPI002810C67F|nr:hypothetical protein [Janthinobacterium sp. J1-1]
MSSPALEAYLAKLYTDDALRQAFLDAPQTQSVLHGLSPQEAEAMAAIDRIGLQMAAASFQHKRAAHGAHAKQQQGWWRRLLERWR